VAEGYYLTNDFAPHLAILDIRKIAQFVPLSISFKFFSNPLYFIQQRKASHVDMTVTFVATNYNFFQTAVFCF